MRKLKLSRRRLELLLSIPKSLYVNMILFPFSKAIHLPVLVRYNTRIIDLKGNVTINGGGRIMIGFGGVSEFDEVRHRSIIKFSGNIVFGTPAIFGAASRIIVEPNAELNIGNHFNNTANLTISCRGKMSIGNDVLVSWDTWICDTDFHKIVDTKTGQVSIPDGKVEIGNHVWICAHSSILKNSVVRDGSIIASHSLVRDRFDYENVLLAGIPAHIKSYNKNYIK